MLPIKGGCFNEFSFQAYVSFGRSRRIKVLKLGSSRCSDPLFSGSSIICSIS
uniref:Uncharacterized protein n=1 Tax=Manihot esculenta TaxID=3983 RepID=A0A2C9V5E0_MANES